MVIQYPYAIGPKYYGVPLFEGDTVPQRPDIFPTRAEGEVALNPDGTIAYVNVTQQGDNYFGPTTARILGGEGSGALVNPVVQAVTGLTLLNPGQGYTVAPNLQFTGGGGQDAEGAAEVSPTGKVTSISINDPGEFYQEPPYILITGGGGSGARATAEVNQGQISAINITDQGAGYTSNPQVIFTKLVNLKRKTQARQSLNSDIRYLTGLVKNVTASDTNIYVDDTSAFPGSGSFIINKEAVSYTAKTSGKFTGLTRGTNFNYDQRVIVDNSQLDDDGNSTYKFNVGDVVIRKVESASNKLARVYDWNPATRELLVTFEVDELAFIDAGIPSTEDAIVQFDGGVYSSSASSQLPHVVLTSQGNSITLLTEPITTLANSAFEDDDELDGVGDGIADLVNTGTQYEGQISLDGGIILGEPGETGRDSKFGIEEAVGGQNTTLFQNGDQIKDASIPFKFSTITTAGGLSEGVEHIGLITLQLDANNANGGNFSVNEVITGQVSGVQAK